MAVSERVVADATQLAIDEINEQGGVLGRPLESVLVDGASDWPTFASEAERLINDEEVSVIFGCWTSASRRTVLPVIERLDHLLFYPVQYEGLEQSPNVVYMGAAPNQQIIPGVKWAFDNLGRSFYLVGSDYVFPRTANAIVRDQVEVLGGEIVGEAYVPLGGSDFSEAVADIVRRRPSVILNTVNGDSNVAFLHQLRAAGIGADEIPTLSFSLDEAGLQTMALLPNAVGDYAVWSYFQSIESDINDAFVARFRERFGSDVVTSDPVEAAYVGVHLWAQAVEEAGNPEPVNVRRQIGRQSYPAPQGPVFVDPNTQHAWRWVRVGQVRGDGQFDVQWASEGPVRPVPFPPTRTRGEWQDFLAVMYDGWGGNWAAPPSTAEAP